jgi:hypothetical protein
MNPQKSLPLIALAIWAAVILLFHMTTGWVPILDSANLAFHEAGHPIFGMLWGRLEVYGGTLMQLLMPGVCAYQMRAQEKFAQCSALHG